MAGETVFKFWTTRARHQQVINFTAIPYHPLQYIHMYMHHGQMQGVVTNLCLPVILSLLQAKVLSGLIENGNILAVDKL